MNRPQGGLWIASVTSSFSATIICPPLPSWFPLPLTWNRSKQRSTPPARQRNRIGRIAGWTKPRRFSTRAHISGRANKGLEFQAAFYVGIDRMAEIHKDLIDKYVYVGLSRARSFLGVTLSASSRSRFMHFESGGISSKAADGAKSRPQMEFRGDQHPLYNQPAAAT